MAEDLIVEVFPSQVIQPVVIVDDNDIELMEGVSKADGSTCCIELNGFFHLQKSNLYLVKIGKQI